MTPMKRMSRTLARRVWCLTASLALLASTAGAQAGFDEAYRKLKRGRTYMPQKSGVIMSSNRTADGIEHNYAVNIPPGHDPARRYQVRFQLHGVIGGRANTKPRGTGEIGPLAGAEQIYV